MPQPACDYDDMWRSLARGDLDRARECVRRIQGQRPNDPMTDCAMAHVANASGRFNEAEEWVDRALALEPDCPHAHATRAAAHLFRREFQQAEEWLTKGESRGHTDHYLLYVKAMVCIAREDYAEAEALLAEACARAPRGIKAQYCVQLGIVQMKQSEAPGGEGRVAQAADSFLAAIEADPAWETAYVKALQYLQRVVDDDLPLTIARQGLEFHPDSAAIRQFLVWPLLARKMDEAADSVVAELVDRARGCQDVLTCVADALREFGRDERAVQVLARQDGQGDSRP